MPADDEWHVDYRISGTQGIGDVNRHSGVFSPIKVGTTEVTAALVPVGKPGPGGTPEVENPVKTPIAEATITVNVVAGTSSYAFQGGRNAIKMLTVADGAQTGYASYNNIAFNGMGEEEPMYLNTLAYTTATANQGKLVSYGTGADEAYYFTVKMTNGFRSFDSPSLFTGINGENVAFVNSADDKYSLGDDSGMLSVFKTDSANKTVVFKLLKSAVQGGGGTLIFGENFRGNNASNTLGTPVSFGFIA